MERNVVIGFGILALALRWTTFVSSAEVLGLGVLTRHKELGCDGQFTLQLCDALSSSRNLGFAAGKLPREVGCVPGWHR